MKPYFCYKITRFQTLVLPRPVILAPLTELSLHIWQVGMNQAFN